MFSAVVLLLSQLLAVQGLYYSDYPILPSYDKAIPADVQENFVIVGVVVSKSSLQSNLQSLKLKSVGKYFTDGDYYEEFEGGKLCSAEIANTPAVFVAGTGSIIGSNQFVTAYHVAEELTGDPNLNNVKNLYIVFNYRQKSTGTLEKQSVYQVAKVVDKSKSEDWVILQTTKGFTHNGGKRFQLASDIPSPNQPIYILGHPLGMPLRYANGKILDVDTNTNEGLHFISSGFAGNSGSPVVRLSDGKVIGLFTSYEDGEGANDFVLNKKCYDYTVSNPNNPIQIKGPLSSKMMSPKVMEAINMDYIPDLSEQHKEL